MTRTGTAQTTSGGSSAGCGHARMESRSHNRSRDGERAEEDCSTALSHAGGTAARRPTTITLSNAPRCHHCRGCCRRQLQPLPVAFSFPRRGSVPFASCTRRQACNSARNCMPSVCIRVSLLLLSSLVRLFRFPSMVWSQQESGLLQDFPAHEQRPVSPGAQQEKCTCAPRWRTGVAGRCATTLMLGLLLLVCSSSSSSPIRRAIIVLAVRCSSRACVVAVRQPQRWRRHPLAAAAKVHVLAPDEFKKAQLQVQEGEEFT